VLVSGGGGYEIAGQERWVWFFDRRTRGPLTAALISGGVTGIISINALVFIGLMVAGQPLGPIGLLFGELAVVALGVGICVGSLRLRAGRRDAPRAELRPLAIVDRRYQMLLDGRLQAIAPVPQVWAQRVMQISSSAPALALCPPRGQRIVVFRGAIVGGGLEPARRVLRELGFRGEG